jgi:hypothetical protein
MSEKNPASDVGVLLLTLQINFIATRRFGDQDHILPKFGKNVEIRLLCSAVLFCNGNLIQKIDLVARSTFDKMLEKHPASDFGVLLLMLQLNFIATRRFGN